MSKKFIKLNGHIIKDAVTGKPVTAPSVLPELPTLTNPATEDEIFLGKEAINGNGEVITGQYEPYELPTLTNPAIAEEVVLGKEFINGNGEVEVGTLEIHEDDQPNKLALLIGPQDAINNPYEITASDLEGVTEISPYAFAYKRGLKSVSAPDATNIGTYAFVESGLVSADLPNATNIGTNAFNNCPSLTSVNTPKVKAIGPSVFTVCQYLTSLTIPATCTSIGQYALRCGSSSNKCTFIFLGTTPPSIQSGTFTASNIDKIIVPVGCGETYKTATNWVNFADYIEEAEE